MNLCYKIERLCSRRTWSSKSRTSEEHRNISPMHECYFSLNRKYRNTHFTLIEERSIHRDTNPSSTLLLSNIPREGLSFEGKLSSLVRWCVPILNPHYVKTSNRSCIICNGTLTPVTSTHICNGCCLAPVTYKRARTTPGLASTTLVTNVDFW
jgi:hypothetical protein